MSVFQAMKFKMHHAEVKKTCTGVIDTILLLYSLSARIL